MDSAKHIVVIGGGIAGMESASLLAEMGFKVTLVEKKNKLGGHVAQWDRIFPSQRNASEITEPMFLKVHEKVSVLLDSEVTHAEKIRNKFFIKTAENTQIEADALVITMGFEEFNARRKEEYGYGIYENVITSIDFEKKLKEEHSLTLTNGKQPSKVAFIHCVGSRDEKVGNNYCSKVCCITAVKQAIEVKELYPEASVYCFYMDLRMFNLPYESIYKQAQLKGVTFIRGRLSEAAENPDGTILLKVEDTLAARPMKLSVNLMVLMVGMTPSEGTRNLASQLKLDIEEYGFIKPADEHLATHATNIPGVFIAGAVSGPANISDTLNQARALAFKVSDYCRQN